MRGGDERSEGMFSHVPLEKRVPSGEPPSGGRNGGRNFRKVKRSSETLSSTADPDA